ncbi:hypothetical protein Tco_0479366 [Tanacetum coccineum]
MFDKPSNGLDTSVYVTVDSSESDMTENSHLKIPLGCSRWNCGGYDLSYQAEKNNPTNHAITAYTSQEDLPVQIPKKKIDVITVVTPSNVKKVESNHESADVKNNGDAVEPKIVRKNSFRPPVIEDWNLMKESEGNPQQKEYKEKGVVASGYYRHMTGNKCYLTEYEDYDGGFVSFGDGKGRISGKGFAESSKKG